MDTVLDRFGRTGPASGNSSFMFDTAAAISISGGGGLAGGIPAGASASTAAEVAAAARKRKLPSLPQIGRSHSLGRHLPPIPSKPPTLVRRRTFDDDDYRTDWI